MKTMLKMTVLANLIFVLVSGGSGRCTELVPQAIHPVSTGQMAQELGVNIGWKPYNTNDIGVKLEFPPTGKLARFDGCSLEVVSDGRQLVSAPLLPSQQTSNKVVLSFMASPDFVQKSTLTLFVDEPAHSDGYRFAMKNFVKMPPTFTFIGVPQTLSTNTFQEIDGLKRKLAVDVVKVIAGSFSGKQVEFSVYAEWPRKPKLGIKYSITAGYGQHGQVLILEYHEI